ncbi:MAG: isopeptide-forming domain-containing fimbrial protein [Oscillospiraceae bacterium]|nr:isopeptide-forming domain-containing fimbrial protein [Oscillospiraceae bacterium]
MTVKIIPSSTASAGDTTDVVLETLDGKQSAVIHVTLLNSPTLSLTLSKSTIKADQTVTVNSVTFTPPGGTPQDVKSSVSYESLTPDVLTIDANGNMTVTGLGTASIQAKYYYNGKEVYDTKNVTVTLSDDFTVQDVTVNKDGTAQISISPPGGTFTFTSADPTIATVSDSGAVTGAAVGNTTITVVRNNDTNNSKTVNVTVNGGLISGTIANKQGGNDLSYTYDVSNHTITIEAFFDHNGSVEPDFSNSSLLKNLIPIKYEALNHVEGGQWQWHMSNFGGYLIESYIENTSNTKSFSEMTGDNYWYVGHGGTDKVVITVKLTATIPADSDLTAYDTYKLVFHDTMSAGVTFDRIDSVTVGETPIEATHYTETATTADTKAGLTWALTINDVIALVPNALTWGTDEIVVEVTYTAHLNNNAIVSNAGTTADNTINNNRVKLEYSNNPDSLGTGGNDKTGETPEDYVWVFTYKVDNTKYKINSSTGNELNGAAFTLHKDTDDGTVVGVTWDATAAGGVGAYVVNGTTSGSMVSGQGDATGTTSGKFNIIGLDAGKYFLVEDAAPTGYNPVEPVEFTITAAHSENTAKNSADLTLSQTNNGTNIPRTPPSPAPAAWAQPCS